MNAGEFVLRLRSSGIELWAEGELLHVRPSSLLTAEQRATIRAEKAAILAFLGGAQCWVRRCPNPAALQALNGTYWCAWHADENRYSKLTEAVLQRSLPGIRSPSGGTD